MRQRSGRPVAGAVTMQQRNIGHAVDLRVMNKESQ